METDTLARALMLFCRAHHKLAISQFRLHDISPGQPPILDYLSRHDGCIQNDLSKSCRLEPATITSSLSNMERDGLVERRACAADRRVWQVYLTPRGRERLEQLAAIQNDVGAVSFRGFSDAELALLEDFIRRMTENLYDALPALELPAPAVSAPAAEDVKGDHNTP